MWLPWLVNDWYLSANLNNKNNLNKHLLKGIKISGVPNNLKNTAFPFEYNKIEQLENIINKKRIAAVKNGSCKKFTTKK